MWESTQPWEALMRDRLAGLVSEGFTGKAADMGMMAEEDMATSDTVGSIARHRNGMGDK